MNRVFNYDKFKLQKSKFWWICILISMILTAVGIIVAAKFSNMDLMFKDYKAIIFQPSGLIYLIMVSIFVGNDFKTGIIKNITSKGIKRSEIVLSKLIWNFILAIAFSILAIITGLITMILFTNIAITSKNLTEILKLTAISTLIMCVYASIYTLMGFIAKSTGITITIAIIVDLIFDILLNVISAFVLKSKEILVASPKFLSSIISGTATQNQTIKYLIIMISIIIISTIISITYFKKQEIK